jgi:hypothetical protein
MAAVECPGCKANITVPDLINCPLCQTPLNPPFLRELREKETRANRAAANAERIQGAKQWLILAVFGVVIALAGYLVYSVVVPNEGQLQARKVSAALLACQQRIAGLAEYGEGETPPYVKNFGKGDEFYFAWQRGSFHFKNGFGASVPMSASCIGSVSTGEIQQLTVNGKTML